MTHSLSARRGARLTLAGTLAGLSAALVLLFSAGHAEAHGPAMAHHGGGLSAKAVAFRSGMDKLWEDHIVWTRMVIVDFAANLPDLQTAEARLLRNQADIGKAIKPYYGAAAGRQLTSLLRTHILRAVPVLQAAKSGDQAALKQSLDAWYANAHQIAVFVSKANPHSWPLRMTDAMMKRHLALTTQEAVARLQGNWTADVAAYDKVHVEILQMSHMLSTGIIRQFPNRFSPRARGSPSPKEGRRVPRVSSAASARRRPGAGRGAGRPRGRPCPPGAAFGPRPPRIGCGGRRASW